MRHAIYFAPPVDSPLWRAGSRWLGRDAASGVALAQPDVPGIGRKRFTSITAAARRYGFHATLKPPFSLARGATEADLDRALSTLAASLDPIVLPALAVGTLDGFLALRLAEPCPALNALAAACVAELDFLRAPPDQAERTRHDRIGLAERESALLSCWGYPWVMEAWRFHMTLTERLADGERSIVERAARQHFAETICVPVKVDALDLFVEKGSEKPFRRVVRYLLAAGRPRGAAS